MPRSPADIEARCCFPHFPHLLSFSLSSSSIPRRNSSLFIVVVLKWPTFATCLRLYFSCSAQLTYHTVYGMSNGVYTSALIATTSSNAELYRISMTVPIGALRHSWSFTAIKSTYTRYACMMISHGRTHCKRHSSHRQSDLYLISITCKTSPSTITNQQHAHSP